MPRGDRLVVLLARGTTLVDDTLDHATCDLHAEPWTAGAIGEREGVRRLDREAGRVDERLRDLDRCHHADDRASTSSAISGNSPRSVSSAPNPASRLRPKHRDLVLGHHVDNHRHRHRGHWFLLPSVRE